MNQNVPMTPFGMAVVTLGLTLEQQDQAKALASVFKIALTDPDIYKVCLHVKENGTMEQALERFAAIGKEISADIAEKSDLLLSAMSMKLGDAIKEKIDDVPAAISAKADEVFERRLDVVLRKNNDDRDKIDFRKERHFREAAIGGVLVLLVAVGGWAYVVGKDIGRNENSQMTAMWQRPDASFWQKAMAYNDGRKLEANYCAPGKKFERNGAEYCTVEIALTRPLVSSDGIDGVRKLWTETQIALGTFGLIAVGAAIGTLLTLWTRRKKA